MEDKEKKEVLEIDEIYKNLEYEKREYLVNIVKENRQLAIRLPQEVVNFLNINPKINKFKFILDEKEKTLKGELSKNEKER